MKTIILILLCVAATTAGAWAQSAKKTDVEKDGLKGRVKSVVCEEQIPDDYECPSGAGDYLTKRYYNPEGSLEYKEVYNPDGSLEYKETYKSDNRGKKVACFYNNSDENLLLIATYKYDDEGNEMERQLYDRNGSLGRKSISEYDDRENRIEYRHYFSNSNEISCEWIFIYDSKGNIIRENIFEYDDSDGRIYYHAKIKYKHHYDNGNRIEITYYIKEDDTCVKYYEYKYDDKGNWTERKYYNEGETEPPYITERTIEYYE
jgi:hypothetical protein